MNRMLALTSLCVLICIAGCRAEEKPKSKQSPASNSTTSAAAPSESTTAGDSVEKSESPGLLSRISSALRGSKSSEAKDEAPSTADTPTDNAPADTVAATAAPSQPAPSTEDGAKPTEASPEPPGEKAATSNPPTASVLVKPTTNSTAPAPTEKAGFVDKDNWVIKTWNSTISIFSIKNSPYWWVYLIAGWLLFSIIAVSVLEGISPWQRPTEGARLGHRIRLDEQSHPFWAGTLFYLPVLWFYLANRDIFPDLSFLGAAKLIGIVVITLVAIVGGWSMGLRWKLHIHYDFFRPFCEARRRFLIENLKLSPAEVTLETKVPDDRVEDFSRFWKTRSQELGVSFKVPSFLDNKALIAEWTFLFPLSVQHVLWVFFIRDGFWTLVDLLAAIPKYTERNYSERIEGQLSDVPDTDTPRPRRHN